MKEWHDEAACQSSDSISENTAAAAAAFISVLIKEHANGSIEEEANFSQRAATRARCCTLLLSDLLDYCY